MRNEDVDEEVQKVRACVAALMVVIHGAAAAAALLPLLLSLPLLKDFRPIAYCNR